MRVVFMGTPTFALRPLEALLASRHEVVAVVTQPDKPGDRGAVSVSAVKKYALSRGLPVLQYARVSKEGVDELRDLHADIFVTAAYGQILSRAILDAPRYGVVNIHASLLPKYRGSSPVQWALINGEKETGVTIMQTAEGLDTGDILMAERIPIGPDDDAGTLLDKLSELGASAIVRFLDELENGGAVHGTPQNEAEATYYPMLKRSDGKIDWTMDAARVLDRMRGMRPWPGTYFVLRGKTVKLHAATLAEGEGRPGEVLSADKHGLIVACGHGALALTELQAEGKKRMGSADFLNGNALKAGEVLE